MDFQTPLFIKEDVSKQRPFDEDESLRLPYEITLVDHETNLQLMRDFTGEKTGFVQVGPKKWFFPSGYVKEAENLYNLELRNDDVFVLTFPRSGTTCTQEIVWLLCNNLDYRKAQEISLPNRFTFLEFSCFVHKDTKKEFLKENVSDPEKFKIIQEMDYPGWKKLHKSVERRFIKTHLPFSLLPPNLTKVGCKTIYVARNPKDVAVSYYHLNRSIRTQGYVGDFSKYWDYLERNLQPWTPYWEHIKEGWSKRHEKNVLFLFYEDIIKDLKGSIQKIAAFLGKSYGTEQIETLANHLKFENFQKNKSVNRQNMVEVGVFRKTEKGFVRNGKNGAWRDYFNQELEERANQWIEENLKNTDLRFPI